MIRGLTVTFAILMLWAGELSAYTLYLRHRALVAGDTVRLRDIARVEGETVKDRIAEKIVIKNPTRPFFVSRDALKQRLQDGPEKLEWVYGSGVWIVPLSRKLGAEEALDVLRKQIDREVRDGADFIKNSRLEFVPDGEILVPPDARLRFSLPGLAASMRAGTRQFTLSVIGLKDGREVTVHRYYPRVKIEKLVTVRVATRDLQPGDRLKAGDWSEKQIHVAEADGRYASGAIEGQRVLTALKAGDIIRAGQVKYQPAVRRGQIVRVVYQTRGVVLQCHSIAQRDGEVGEHIPVRVVFEAKDGASKTPVTVKIIGDQLAVVEARNE